MSGYRKHYLITGAAGFIGSHLVRSLPPDIRLTCIDNFDPFYRRALKLLNTDEWEQHRHIQMVERDLTSLTVEELKEIVPEGVDCIIHLAARAGVRPSIQDPLGYQQVNVLGTQTLIDFAVATGVPQFVFASSSSVYGVNPNLPWKEGEPLLPISPYAQTKLAGEMAGHVASHLYGLRFIALRFFTVYGPGQRPDLAIHKFTKSLLRGQSIPVYGDGSTSRDYTYVEDIVSGIRAAIDYTGSLYEVVNLGNHYGIPLHELISMLESVTGLKAEIDRQPEQPGDVPHTFADISKAQRLFHYRPATPLRTGLERFWEWFNARRDLLLQD